MIKDGTGRGYLSKVDSKNRLWTYSTIRPEIAFKSEFNQKAFMVSNLLTSSVSGSYHVGHMTYNGNGSLHVDKIIISSNSELAEIDVILNTTYTSGGVLLIPSNLNLSSKIESMASPYCNTTHDLSFEYDITKSIAHIVLSKCTYDFVLDGGLILKNNNSFGMIGQTQNTGEGIRTSIFYYEEEEIL